MLSNTISVNVNHIMTEENETYCRLCAEPTPLEQLISSNDDVAKSSKIEAKMLWINVDISESNTLPTTICFSCFDLLERTWSFLHSVREAQEKLTQIFSIKQGDENPKETVDKKLDVIAKPVNENWDEFSSPKKEVKVENSEDYAEVPINTNSLNLNDDDIKVEEISFDGDINHFDDYNSTDSDMPLQFATKRKKQKKKKKDIAHVDIDVIDDVSNEEIALESLVGVTWEDYLCRCAICDAQCKNIAFLRLHSMQIHSCCCSFKCSDCGKILLKYKSFINHVKSHKNLLKYCCDICNKQFILPELCKFHKKNEHQSIYSGMCTNCGGFFETDELLQSHMQEYAKSLRKRNRKCEKAEEDLKCKDCGKEFKSSSNLQQHIMIHMERRRDFSCHVCGKMFYTKGTLSTHMQTHEDTKPFKCEFCPMSFRARGNLQSHISMHSSVKPFVCEQCGKSFRVKRHLKSHSIVHTDLMPYQCEYCHKTFRFKTRLNLHVRQHTGAKPYNCTYCKRDFTNGSNFKKHMKRRHNIDTSKRKYNNIVLTETL